MKAERSEVDLRELKRAVMEVEKRDNMLPRRQRRGL